MSQTSIQLIDLSGQREILFRQTTMAMGHQAEPDIVPTVNQYVGVMIHRLGGLGDAINKAHRGFEVFEF